MITHLMLVGATIFMFIALVRYLYQVFYTIKVVMGSTELEFFSEYEWRERALEDGEEAPYGTRCHRGMDALKKYDVVRREMFGTYGLISQSGWLLLDLLKGFLVGCVLGVVVPIAVVAITAKNVVHGKSYLSLATDLARTWDRADATLKENEGRLDALLSRLIS